MSQSIVDPPVAEKISGDTTGKHGAAPKLNSLTTLRFFAAAMIVILHTRGSFGVPETLLAPLTLGQGVTFFFVLSGFILAYVYPSLDRNGVKRFFIARIARIWPLHVTAFLLFLAVIPRETPPVPGSITPGIAIINLALLQAWFPSNRFQFSFNAPSWSVSVELFFYCCFPLLIAGWRRTWAVKLGVALALALGMVFITNTALHLLPAGTTVAGLVYNYPLTRLWEFTLGIAAMHLWRKLQSRVLLTRASGTVLEVMALGLAVLVIHQSYNWMIALNTRWPLGEGGILWVLETAFASLPFALLLCVLSFESGWVSRLLSWSPLVLLGEISFGIYLLHIPILLGILYHPTYFVRIAPGMMYPFYWLVVILVSYLSWSVIETPIRRTVVAWWDRRVANHVQPIASSRVVAAQTQRLPGLTTPTWRRSLVTAVILLSIGAALFTMLPTINP